MCALRVRLTGASLALWLALAGNATAWVHLRAVKPLPHAAIAALAAVGAPTVLTAAKYPDAAKFSAREIIEVLCGTFQPAYWNETKSRNRLKGLSASQRLGALAYSIRWPACTYALKDPRALRISVRPGDTAAGLYTQLTGATGSKVAIQQFFGNADARNLENLRPGQLLSPALASYSTKLEIQDASGFDKIIRGTVDSSLPVYFQMNGADDVRGANAQTPAPLHLLLPAGKIASGQNGTYDPPAECLQPGAATATLDVTRISAAYAIAKAAIHQMHLPQSTAEVVVADNGFFGARLQNGRPQFGAAFPPRFFYTSATYDDGQIGPLVTTADDTVIYPLNYSNRLTDVNVISGHGTHITGLVIGGPSFQQHLDIFDRANDDAWLRLILLNIGKGSADLIVGSEKDLADEVGYLKDKIINLSLSYDDNAQQSVEILLRNVISLGDQHNNLFVVAAGNDGKRNVQSALYWPAALGGFISPNVITVAALREDGVLTGFTNRGARAVDLAAPGCELPSWLDDSATVTAVSGTSQAAAVTTFAAALLRSLGNPSARWIKRRLFVSGELLDSQGGAGDIASRSRLDIATALYAMEDYIRFRPEAGGEDREALGQVVRIDGVGCDADSPGKWQDIWAIKSDGAASWLFTGKSGQVLNPPCSAVSSNEAVLYFSPRILLNKDGTESSEPVNKNMPPVPLSAIRSFVAKTIPRSTD